MSAKMIYFTQENDDRLKKEDNMSKLINNLLNEHYNSTIPIEIRYSEAVDNLNQGVAIANELEEEMKMKNKVNAEKSKQEDDDWEKEKAIKLEKHNIRKQYEAETHRDNQSVVGFEEYYATKKG